MNIAKRCFAAATFLLAGTLPLTSHAVVGYADVVLEFFDSGAGPMSGPYGGTYPDGPGFPMPVSTSVVLGPDPGPTGFTDFLSLPFGSYVTVGFTDESIIDGIGNDIFIQEIGGNGERAEVFVSADKIHFVSLGIAVDNATTVFDLSSISFLQPVQAVRIVGLDNLGGSPGFDVVNVQVMPNSIGNPVPQVPEPSTTVLLGAGALTAAVMGRRRRKSA